MLFSIYAEDIGTLSPLGPRFLPNSARDRMKVLGDYPPDNPCRGRWLKDSSKNQGLWR